MKNLQFVKLGGSLITEKDAPEATLRPEVLARLVDEISAAKEVDPTLRILLGHGSGSFAHRPAKKYQTRTEVSQAEGWRLFVETWREAARLNRFVMDALAAANLSAMAFPASAGAMANDGFVMNWALEPIETALSVGLMPVVYGDVAFDYYTPSRPHGTILSTETLFYHLAQALQPRSILLTGVEAGIYADYPQNKNLLPTLGRRQSDQLINTLLGSAAEIDTTGGMVTKVGLMLGLLEDNLEIDIRVFSGLEPGNLQAALAGEAVGTRLVAE